MTNRAVEKEISFSLVDGPSKFNKQRLVDMAYLEFEDTLKLVDLPHFEFEKPEPVPSKFGHKTPMKDGEGRNDYAFVFDWLRKKGVRRILNLSVDDHKEPSHSDETIENALAGNEIEVMQNWDWQKPDLSSETIFKAAREVEEVRLYWTGNNAILRSLSEPEGLNMLEKLRKITVSETQVSAERHA